MVWLFIVLGAHPFLDSIAFDGNRTSSEENPFVILNTIVLSSQLSGIRSPKWSLWVLCCLKARFFGSEWSSVECKSVVPKAAKRWNSELRWELSIRKSSYINWSGPLLAREPIISPKDSIQVICLPNLIDKNEGIQHSHIFHNTTFLE